MKLPNNKLREQAGTTELWEELKSLRVSLKIIFAIKSIERLEEHYQKTGEKPLEEEFEEVREIIKLLTNK